MVVPENRNWFPFNDEFERRNTLLGNPSVLLRQCEISVRGHDITGAFSDPMLDVPWNSFYFFAEHQALHPGLVFLEASHKKGVDAGAAEIGRSLICNRLPNTLFTRDKVLFYEMQRSMAKRANWRQTFQLSD
jgi:hypothetical protein